MEGLVNTPSKILAAKTLPSSSTISPSIAWIPEIYMSKSSNRSCPCLLYASLPHCKRFRSDLPLFNSEIIQLPSYDICVGLRIETAKTKFLHTKLPARGSNDVAARDNDEDIIVDTEGGEGLVVYDEGHVLVPGLTEQMITEEALVEELHKSIQAKSRIRDGESMKDNDNEEHIPP